jgi:putative NADH-flavin reductase
MRIAVLGGSGRIGQHILTSALESGHQVCALVRRPEALAAASGLTVIKGDVSDANAVADLVADAEAVLSALGPRGAKTPALLATAGRNVVAGMGKAGVRRLICVSAAGAFIRADPDTGVMVKLILPTVLAKQFADVREMEAIVASSDLDWTMVRATRLVNSPPIGQYRVRPDYPPPGGGKIARADVARFMLTCVTERSWVREQPAVAY